MSERRLHPVYPELTDAQWAVLNALTDQRCVHLIEAIEFVNALSPEAKDFLRTADKPKVDMLNDTVKFFSTSKSIWKFLFVGVGGFVAFFVGVFELWKAFGEYFTIKLK